MALARYDVIVIGGGHAGVEAALAAARAGVKTLLITHSIETIGQMSCNPSIGGIGKGHLVKEIDALGGIMGRAADLAGIHFRILNASKGPAVRATRAQADRLLYKQAVRNAVEQMPNLSIFQQPVDDLIVDANGVQGVVTQCGIKFLSQNIIMTTGTFLAGKIHVGLKTQEGGRAGELPSNTLAHRLRELNLPQGRLKTGTPPRLDARTIDFSVMEPQHGDTPVPVFSFLGKSEDHPRQIPCYITHTTEQTHDIIRTNLEASRYDYLAEGPRYCPSIDKKVMAFSEKTSHQIFVEPEGLTTYEIYPNGLSTCLGYESQLAFIRSIPGFEHACITRPGYAIEYDFFDPQALLPSLETRAIPGLFFAGQINGTTGYEEAAAQGVVAGINAARRAQDLEPWHPTRQTSYIGVLIDDLITQGTQEPYRMFTSRAEYRLLLREDNADLRLTPIGYTLGVVTAEHWQAFEKKQLQIETLKTDLKNYTLQPTAPEATMIQETFGVTVTQALKLQDLVKRPEIQLEGLLGCIPHLTATYSEAVFQQVDIQTKYAGYIQRQEEEVERLAKYQNFKIPGDFDFSKVKGFSNEVAEKLQKVRPTTLGMASRIPGITKAALSLLLVHLRSKQEKEKYLLADH